MLVCMAFDIFIVCLFIAFFLFFELRMVKPLAINIKWFDLVDTHAAYLFQFFFVKFCDS